MALRRRTRSMSQSSDEELEPGISIMSSKKKKPEVLETIIASPDVQKKKKGKKQKVQAEPEPESTDEESDNDKFNEPEQRVVEFVDKEELATKEADRVAKKAKAIAATKGKKALKKLAERQTYDSDSQDEEDIPEDDDMENEDSSEEDDDSDDDENGSDEEGEHNNSKKSMRNTKKQKVVGGGMAAAFGKILSQNLPETSPSSSSSTTTLKAPVLAKRKTKLMKEAEEERLSILKLKTTQESKKKLKEVGLHEPDYKDIEHERSLRRVATRGVVALFNAISKHQHKANEDGGGDNNSNINSTLLAQKTARDVKQLSKDNFIQMLKGNNNDNNNASSAFSSSSTTTESSSSSSMINNELAGGKSGNTVGASAWLRDDFMTMGGKGKSIKDWERHEEQGGSDDDDDSESDDDESDDENSTSKFHEEKNQNQSNKTSKKQGGGKKAKGKR